jgi:hypothetical protein
MLEGRSCLSFFCPSKIDIAYKSTISSRLFEIAFDIFKNIFNTKKIYFFKKLLFNKKIKSVFKNPKKVKIIKTYF